VFAALAMKFYDFSDRTGTTRFPVEDAHGLFGLGDRTVSPQMGRLQQQRNPSWFQAAEF
jgi:hypothetical protein